MKTINITIAKQDVLNNVARVAYALGQVAGSENDRVAWLIQGVTDKGKTELIETALRDGWEKGIDAMMPYVVSDETNNVTLTCELNVNDNSRYDLARALKQHLQKVLEYSCVSAWKLLMGLDSSIDIATMNSEAWRLKVLLNTRMGVDKQVTD